MIHATSQITLAWNAIEDGLYETSGSWKARKFNFGLTSAHRRLKHQDKTLYTSFASTWISHSTLYFMHALSYQSEMVIWSAFEYLFGLPKHVSP